MRIIDLSVAIENDLPVDRPGNGPVITYFDHSQTFTALAGAFPGLRPSDLPDGEAWAVERIDLSTHNGTHLDAPWHYASTMNNGARASTIDEIPLDWCFRPAVKLDFRHLPDGHVVSAIEVEDELDRIGHTLAPYDIVLVNTSAGERYGQPEYLNAGCGMGREATLYLTERGVQITGTDAWSWDAPFSATARRFAETKDPSIIWEGHKAGRETEYCHLEKLRNLEKLPASGFRVICFPVKIRAASAGWTRAVALLDEDKGNSSMTNIVEPLAEATPLIGTWSLREAFAIDGDGRRLYDVYGSAPTGFITYCADRRMMALITHDGRSLLDGDRQSAPDGQKVEAYSSSIAYAGTYDFDGTTVVHHIEASTYPNWVGTDLVRRVKINDDHICLRTLPQMQNGVLVVMELIWTRVTS